MTRSIDHKTRHDDGSESWREIQDDGQVKQTRRVHAMVWQTERYNCFCCSCDDTGMMIQTDPACRNHGYGFGKRPCLQHSTEGSPWTIGVDEGTMPKSVEEKRAEDKVRHDAR